MSRRPLLVLLIAAAALGPDLARADAATEARLRDALRSTTAQLRALEDERQRWQQAEAQLRRELETLHGLPSPSSAADRNLAAANRRVSEQQAANARLKESLARCQASVPATAAPTVGQLTEDERKKKDEEIAKLREALSASEARNVQMYRVGKDLIAWLHEIGVGGEPFFGWKRVQLENAAQQYEDRLTE